MDSAIMQNTTDRQICIPLFNPLKKEYESNQLLISFESMTTVQLTDCFICVVFESLWPAGESRTQITLRASG